MQLTEGIGLILQWIDHIYSTNVVGQNGTTAKTGQRKTQHPSFSCSQGYYLHLLFYTFSFLSFAFLLSLWFHIYFYPVYLK